MRSTAEQLSLSTLRGAFAVLVVAAILAPASAGAQFVPPTSYPPDSAFTPVSCADPTAIPSQDSCTDEARDHRNIVGSGATPAYLHAQDGTYLFLRIRVEDDPRQGGALVAFAWGFGLDNDGDGQFEAYVSLIGQGMADRLEIQDQDASNGTTPNLALPAGAGTDTSLRPILTDLTAGTWASVIPAPPVGAMVNFCADDTDLGDWYITVAVPLAALIDFGALGGAVAYGGSSSEFSGLQNDIVCADGRTATCTLDTMCATGVCLDGIGNCAPPVVPFFLGCVASDTNLDGVDEGCTAAARHCLVGGGTSRCVACLLASECDDANACTTDACASNACARTPVAAGTSCPGGACNGSAVTPMCVPATCTDSAAGTMLDAGCTAAAPICDTSGGAPVCVACISALDCDDGNACTTDACTAGACARTSDPAGSACVGGVCDGAAAPICTPCLDTAAGTMQDSGCSPGAPVCDTSGAIPRCTGCTFDGDCDDLNECTVDSCTLGACTATSDPRGTTCATGVCDGSAVLPGCVPCVDDASGTMQDTGCAAGAPVCDTSGAVPTCIGCTLDTDCDDANACTADACIAGACAVAAEPEGTTCPAGVCDGSTMCVACVDDGAGADRDAGCTGLAALCDDGGLGGPVCVICFDLGSGFEDLGCTAPDEVCLASGATAVCIACEDTAAGVDTDFGCAASAPICGTLGGTAGCVECVIDSECAAGELCDSATGMCAMGCDEPSDCAAPTPACDVASGICVECLGSGECAGTEICTPGRTCAQPDTDGDGVPDDVDLDDDDDGVPDAEEIGEALVGDDDDDGILDFEDASEVTCADAAGDGICDELPTTVDFDADGIANHLDLDADGDGLTDLREGGGRDRDEDGRVDDLADADGNGLDDRLMATPLPLPDTDGAGGPDFLDLDADGDGLTDIREADGEDPDGDGRAGGADADGDGLADAVDPDAGGSAWTGPDTDRDGTPDWQDRDSDGDGAADLIEGGDANHDGMTDRAPSGDDTDGDGIDDTFDPDDGGTTPAEPDTDDDGTADWRDDDDDGDGVATGREDVGGNDTPVDDDTDDDGTPDYLDTDDDGDGIPTRDEDVNDDGDYTNDDGDADGTPDYLDRDRPTRPVGGISGGALCSFGGGSPDAGPLALLGLAALVLGLRRRRRR